MAISAKAIGEKIALYTNQNNDLLRQHKSRNNIKSMNIIDVANFMVKNGSLSQTEFETWLNGSFTKEQVQQFKSGQSVWLAADFGKTQDYVDEMSPLSIGNMLGFERTTNEKTGKTETKSKAVSKQKYNVAEEMKKQSFMNYIKSLPTPEATYTELMRSIEFEKLDNQGKMEMMLKISGEKFNEAKERGDKQAMKDYLLEGIGMALQLSCQKIDSTIGITQFKDWAKERSGLNFLVDLVDKYVDDGDDATLSWLEKNWEGVKGFGDALDSFLGTQAVAFIGALQIAGAAAGTGVIGQAFNIATKAYFLYDGGKMMVDGATGYYNAETKQEARQAGQEFGMGTVIFTGTLKSVIGEIQAYRASHAAPEGQGGLPELSEGHKAILEENVPATVDKAQVSTDLAFLQQNGVEIVKFNNNGSFYLMVNGKATQIKTQSGVSFEQGLSGLVKEIKSETNIEAKIMPDTKPIDIPTTAEGMKQAILDAKDWDSLRALNKGMKTMPQEVKELYIQRENQLRTELSPKARGVVNWNIQTHLAITEHALEGYEGLSPELKRYIARASELPDLDPKELVDANAAHFYDVLHEDPSYGMIDDANNNALSRFLAHTEVAKERSKAGDLDGFLKEVGYAIHYLQDAGTPPHTEHGNYLQKLWRIPMHKAFEKGKNVGATPRLPMLKENYTPEEIPFSTLESLFHNTALFTVQPENHVSYGNVKYWPEIQQRSYDRGVNVSKAYLDYILQYLPKEEKSKTGKTSAAPVDLQAKKTISELLEEPKIQDLLGYEVEVKYKSGKIRRMTLKEKLQKLGKQDEKCVKSINDVIEMAEKAKNQQRIKTKELVDIRDKFCSTKINDLLYDIECTLEYVKDEKISDFVQKELTDIKTNTSKLKDAKARLENIQLAIDAYNVAEGHYTYIGDKKNPIEYPEYRIYLDYLDKDANIYNTKLHSYPTFREKYINDPYYPKMHTGHFEFLSEYRTKAAELQKNMRYTRLMEFCFKNPDSELSTHLYKEYYLKQAGFPKNIQKMCLEISEKYNTKLFLPKKCKGAEETIKYVAQELAAFSDAMKGTDDRLRHVIDFSEQKEAFQHKRSGKVGAGGYIKKDVADNLVNIPGFDLEVVQYSLRHELMHTFDTKFGVQMDDVKITIKERTEKDDIGDEYTLQLKSSKYDDEFIKAGLDEYEIIDYAYTNSKEFVAVAAEGNMSSYSEGFKQLLISKGMPEWAFKLRTINPQILSNIK